MKYVLNGEIVKG